MRAMMASLALVWVTNLYKSRFDGDRREKRYGSRAFFPWRPTGATTEDAEVDDVKYGFVAWDAEPEARVLLARFM